MTECNGHSWLGATSKETAAAGEIVDEDRVWQESSDLGLISLDEISSKHPPEGEPFESVDVKEVFETEVLEELTINRIDDDGRGDDTFHSVKEEENLKSINNKKTILVSPDSAPVSCTVCNLVLKNTKNLRAHMKTHGGEKNFRCPNCPKTFLRSNQMKSHQKVHTGERPYECDICFKTFSQSSNFLVHKNTHLEIPINESLPFKCDICQRTFGQQLYLRTHMKVHTERDPMRCKLCRRKYDRQEDLDRHSQEHVALKLFRCLDCGKEFERYINLKNHRFIHTGIKPHTCTICGKSFSHTTSLAVHLRTHTGEKPFECSKCDNTFSQWANYHRHLRTHDKKPEHRCDVCDMTFTKTSSLKSHVRKHKQRKEAKYICDTCGRGFMKRSTFEKHVKAHLNGCLVCGEMVGGGIEYAEHMRAKHRNKKITCEICRKRFTSVRQIRHHMDLVHVPPDECLYKCDQCDLVDNEFTLDAHVRREHPAYRMHNCPNCPLNFVHTELLLIHVKEHLGQKQCEQCGKLFRKHGLYKRHQCVRAEHMREIRERNEEQQRRLKVVQELPEELLQNVESVDIHEAETLKRDNEAGLEMETLNDEDLLVIMKPSSSEDCLVKISEEDDAMLIEELFSNNISIDQASEDFSGGEPDVDQTIEVDALKHEFKREVDPIGEIEIEESKDHVFDLHSDDVKEKAKPIEGHTLDDFEDDQFGSAEFQTNAQYSPAALKSEENTKLSDETQTFMCAVCGRSFATVKRLNVHSKSHEKHRFQCDQCAMSFVRSSELKTHMRGHTGERPFQCEICSKCFTQSSALYTHHRVHSGERPFSCTICQKRFKQSSARKRHEALHSGEKPFMCTVCGKSFVTADGLQVHAKMHEAKLPKIKKRPLRPPKPIRVKTTKVEPELGPNGYYGDLPYPCEVCRKTFAKACTLWMHSKIHTGEKNFKCDQCPKAFAQGANLKRHKLSHTGKRPFQCFECTKWFAKQETLDAHMELHADVKRQQAVSVFQMQRTSAVGAIVITTKEILQGEGKL